MFFTPLSLVPDTSRPLYWRPKRMSSLPLGEQALAHHPTSIDSIEYFDVRKALNVISGATFIVRRNTKGSQHLVAQGLVLATRQCCNAKAGFPPVPAGWSQIEKKSVKTLWKTEAASTAELTMALLGVTIRISI